MAIRFRNNYNKYSRHTVSGTYGCLISNVARVMILMFESLNVVLNDVWNSQPEDGKTINTANQSQPAFTYSKLTTETLELWLWISL